MVNELECNREHCTANTQSKRYVINRHFKKLLTSFKIEGSEGMSKTK